MHGKIKSWYSKEWRVMNWRVINVTVIYAVVAQATVSFIDDGLGPPTPVFLTLNYFVISFFFLKRWLITTYFVSYYQQLESTQFLWWLTLGFYNGSNYVFLIKISLVFFSPSYSISFFSVFWTAKYEYYGYEQSSRD